MDAVSVIVPEVSSAQMPTREPARAQTNMTLNHHIAIKTARKGCVTSAPPCYRNHRDTGHSIYFGHEISATVTTLMGATWGIGTIPWGLALSCNGSAVSASNEDASSGKLASRPVGNANETLRNKGRE